MAATTMGITFVVLKSLGLRFSADSKFEYSSLDIAAMTKEATKDAVQKLYGVRQQSRRPQSRKESLIPEVLQDLEETGGNTAPDAVAPQEELDVRAKALTAVGAPPFRRFLKDRGAADLSRSTCEVFQLNIGLYCNQACTHCHVESSPLRNEMMSEEVVERCLYLLEHSPDVKVLDLTGGAPEMNKGFRRLVEGAAELRKKQGRNLKIIDRCNLTVLSEPGYDDLPGFLRKHNVDIVASLPSYDPGQTDRQRGRKVFERSIEGLRMLNAEGYGKTLRLDLIFNPPGPFLPPKQEALEERYRKEMGEKHGIAFDSLITLANMPVKRFFDHLRKQGTLEGYMDLLVRNFNPDTVPQLMCTNTLSVSWEGKLYDCDFNQQLDMKLGRPTLTVFNVESLNDEKLQRAPIATSAHCFGCTATQGSS
jgi:radical SAM/Cys-rich protein